MKQKRILLVNCVRSPTNLHVAPINCATIAGLTPKTYYTEIWDENIKGPCEERATTGGFDLVGISCHTETMERACAVSACVREKNIYCVIGGPGISCEPEMGSFFDVSFIGEAERTWPQFLREWEQGSFRRMYRQIDKPEMSESPPPDWSSIADMLATAYQQVVVQPSRGCPFDCDFCDAIYLFGRRHRNKPIPQVVQEIQTLQKLGCRYILLGDDEFCASREYSRELLPAMIETNNAFPVPLRFNTEMTLTVAGHDDLLELLSRANVTRVLLGLESPHEPSLRECNKRHNIRPDMAADVRKILSYGIPVTASFIVGFDNDGLDIFEKHNDFYNAACIPGVRVQPLLAYKGTRLWNRMQQEGRLLDQFAIERASELPFATNIIPQQMTRKQLLEGWAFLCSELRSWDNLCRRLRGWMELVHFDHGVREPPPPGDDAFEQVYDALRLSPAERRTGQELVEFTRQKAPFMMHRIKYVIDDFIPLSGMYESYIRIATSNIAFEERSPVTHMKITSTYRVPPAFARDFRKVLDPVYRRVYLNLTDKEGVVDAIVEICVDFLVRIGESLESIDRHHITYLLELCDRTCARRNGVPSDEFQPVVDENETMPIPNWRRARLGDSLLKAIADELVQMSGGRTTDELRANREELIPLSSLSKTKVSLPEGQGPRRFPLKEWKYVRG